jgi:hypothetical protein
MEIGRTTADNAYMCKKMVIGLHRAATVAIIRATGTLLQGGIPGKKAVGGSLNSANRNQKNFQIRIPHDIQTNA